MISKTTKQFRRLFASLPSEIQKSAVKAFRLWKRDPYHSSLHFKCVCDDPQTFSARVSRGYRALGARNKERIVWFWIGPHAEYDSVVAQL